jgi:cytochrome c-type biogenesis protein CcmE
MEQAAEYVVARDAPQEHSVDVPCETQPAPPADEGKREVVAGARPRRYSPGMGQARKRKIRLVVALVAAVLLAVALVFTSLNASSEAVSPSGLRDARSGVSYQLTGKVQAGSVHRASGGMSFRVRDRDGSASVAVRYAGAVPDPFREGREVIVTVRRAGGVFVAQRDSLVTKCPSKFTEEATRS